MQGEQIYDSFFHYQVKSMYAGIETTMEKKESFYTCALALSTYTEVMGGLVTGNLKQEGHSKENYDAFLSYLGEKYLDLNNKLKEQGLSLHKIIRSKLVHEFALRESHMIIKADEPLSDRIGIEIQFFNNKITQVNIWIKEYYRDFKNGIEKYYQKLGFSLNQPPLSDGQTLFVNFMKAMT